MKNPIPINSCWYFFSITNAEEFLDKGFKPFLEEYGPICYEYTFYIIFDL